jgi:hypothetical protein
VPQQPPLVPQQPPLVPQQPPLVPQQPLAKHHFRLGSKNPMISMEVIKVMFLGDLSLCSRKKICRLLMHLNIFFKSL